MSDTVGGGTFRQVSKDQEQWPYPHSGGKSEGFKNHSL